MTAIQHDLKTGFYTITCGTLVIVLPDTLEDGADERAEIRCNGSRVFVEAHDDGPLVSTVERFS